MHLSRRTIHHVARTAIRRVQEHPVPTLKGAVAFTLLLLAGPRSWAILTGSSSRFAGVYLIGGLILSLTLGLAIGSAMRRLGFKQKDASK